MNPHPFSQTDGIRSDLESGNGLIRIKPDSKDIHNNNPQEWFLSFAKKIGTPVSQSASGELILSIRNESYDQDDSRTRGPNTNRKLGFHTDRCDVIGFLCLQPAKSGGENQVVSSPEVEKIIRKKRPDLHETLCQPFPYKRHTVDRGNNLPYCEQPIFSWEGSHFACSYLRVLIDRADQDSECPDLSNEQRDALDFFDSICERETLQKRFTLEAGEILFLNNWTTLHRRTAFDDFEEPEKRRHLLRVWLSVPNSRPLNESFRANFGATEAGAVRGGMQPSGNR
jgi:hypothetical protein